VPVNGAAELNDVVGSHDVVLVDFYADWWAVPDARTRGRDHRGRHGRDGREGRHRREPATRFWNTASVASRRSSSSPTVRPPSDLVGMQDEAQLRTAVENPPERSLLAGTVTPGWNGRPDRRISIGPKPLRRTANTIVHRWTKGTILRDVERSSPAVERAPVRWRRRVRRPRAPDRTSRRTCRRTSTRARRRPASGVELAGRPIAGEPDAPVDVYYWTDYLCPFLQGVRDGDAPRHRDGLRRAR